MSFEAWAREIRLRLENASDPGEQAPARGEREEPEAKSRQEPPGIGEIHRERVKSFSTMNRLHAQLPWIPTAEQRLRASLRILELERRNRRCWEIIEHHEATGETLSLDPQKGQEPFDPSGHSPDELIRIRNNDRSYISKAKKGGYPPEKVEYRKNRIEAIEDYLNAT